MKSMKQKQNEAKARQEAHNKLSVRQQLDKLDAGGFTAKRERSRLNVILSTMEQVKAEGAAKKVPSKKVK
jgi:hypothetical protein